MKEEQIGEILIYQSEEGNTKIEVRLQNENVWLSQQQMAELYQSSRTNVVEHIKHIYEEGELSENSTCRKFRQVQTEGSRSVEREIPFYNLDMIISLGYRIKSHIATKFRIWATERLKEYIVKGFTMDDERLKQMGGGGYWYELLNRIGYGNSYSSLVLLYNCKVSACDGEIPPCNQKGNICEDGITPCDHKGNTCEREIPPFNQKGNTCDSETTPCGRNDNTCEREIPPFDQNDNTCEREIPPCGRNDGSLFCINGGESGGSAAAFSSTTLFKRRHVIPNAAQRSEESACQKTNAVIPKAMQYSENHDSCNTISNIVNREQRTEESASQKTNTVISKATQSNEEPAFYSTNHNIGNREQLIKKSSFPDISLIIENKTQCREESSSCIAKFKTTKRIIMKAKNE